LRDRWNSAEPRLATMAAKIRTMTTLIAIAPL
jgi:hypothetical protein